MCNKVARALNVHCFIKANLGKDIFRQIKAAYSECFDPRPSAPMNAMYADFLEDFCAETGLMGQEVADRFDFEGWTDLTLSGDIPAGNVSEAANESS